MEAVTAGFELKAGASWADDEVEEGAFDEKKELRGKKARDRSSSASSPESNLLSFLLFEKA